MSLARIYQPTKNAMQSGKAKDSWLLEYAQEKPYFVDSLMGWTGMEDTKSQQIRLFFDSPEEAIKYAEKNGITYEVEMPNPNKQMAKAYADNFSFRKIKG